MGTVFWGGEGEISNIINLTCTGIIDLKSDFEAFGKIVRAKKCPPPNSLHMLLVIRVSEGKNNEYLEYCFLHQF